MNYIYLASPYTSPDLLVQRRRASQAAQSAAILMQMGETVYSPIVHGHTVAMSDPELSERSHRFWMQQCYPLLHHAYAMYVLQLDGWQDSKGVQLEIDYARQHGKPIYASRDGWKWSVMP